ncbi:tRNA (adenosine(37)-N6)-threonylcarbamoyltransferase complex ATPase subunit type 1 TsaE [Arthrobacter sp. NamB2]|uniref:tRNA (adenosine(37)-N6)-threonylcarbamoyltransferase complex ATPase subunit type 1 TsaE n=1 Tax=Arthrobacter sp. NamB2 TaxID=2576035 RepID=UPI0010C93EE9|nr:tRNA (adenosine(37)-N6)-threonylcarbamoyltransferase complex ATPase subunit type 1 TsaE [Arthrobacter sp. NamB2]TKV29541.1 tRNA (adenosine(37)-N6)-threonylcarbamoyltransferase complex ATPase subunit type 1 TsaE [Arthrobacter sp. NamB2]
MTAQPEWSATYDVRSAAELKALGARLAPSLRPADLLVLSGELGAGKTTFTQGLGRGLEVEDRIISPTFVLVRQHPAAGDGPGLVHVDAYRLESAAAVDDLDLESTMAANVTVIEWGAGRVEHLSDSWLRVDITRPLGGTPDTAPSGTLVTHFDDDGEDEVRTVTVSGFGPRWRDRLPALPLD